MTETNTNPKKRKATAITSKAGGKAIATKKPRKATDTLRGAKGGSVSTKMRNLAAAIRSMKDKEPISNVVEEVIQAANIEEVPTRLPQALVKALRAAISEDIRHEQCERKGQGKKPLMLADRDSLSANTPTWALAEHIAADPLVREFTQEYRKSVAVKAYVSALMLAYPEVVDVGDVPEKEDST